MTKYIPATDAQGNVYDAMPQDMTHGVYCPCVHHRKTYSVFTDPKKLKSHWKSKTHMKWISAHKESTYEDECRKFALRMGVVLTPEQLQDMVASKTVEEATILLDKRLNERLGSIRHNVLDNILGYL